MDRPDSEVVDELISLPFAGGADPLDDEPAPVTLPFRRTEREEAPSDPPLVASDETFESPVLDDAAPVAPTVLATAATGLAAPLDSSRAESATITLSSDEVLQTAGAADQFPAAPSAKIAADIHHEPDAVPASEGSGGLLVSLASWTALFAAGALFAIASLAPKWHQRAELSNQYTAQQWELVAQEEEIRRWDRVIEAAQHDEQFAAQVTRVEFDAQRPDEEVLPVDRRLASDGRIVRAVVPPALPVPQAWEVVLTAIAQSSPLRRTILGCAGVFALASFMLPALKASHLRTGGEAAGGLDLRRRYWRREMA